MDKNKRIGRPKIKCVVCAEKISHSRVRQRKVTCSASCSARLRWQKNREIKLEGMQKKEAERDKSFWQFLAGLFGDKKKEVFENEQD
jgi:hypothetical protein